MDVSMATPSFHLFLTFLLLSCASIAAKDDRELQSSMEEKLITDLLKRNTIMSRPVSNTSDTLHAKFGIALISIDDIDEQAQTMETLVWFRQLWTDHYLSWDPKDYDGIDHVRIPSKKIWQPDFVIYNSRHPKVDVYESLAVVSSDGNVLYIPSAHVITTCSIDSTYFPMDTQICQIKIGSWTYDGFKLDIDFYDGMEEVDVTDYIMNNEWRLVDHPARKNVKYYPCCKEPYPDLTFTLKIQRFNAYYQVVLIAPAVLLALLTPFIFLLPPADPQKMMLGVGLLISFAIFFNLVSSVPIAKYNIPLVDQYYIIQYILITVSIMLSALVANIARRTIRLSRPPAIITKVVLSCLGRCMCVSENMYSDLPTDDEHKNELMETGVSRDQGPSREWLLIATVIDRLFFLLSLITTILLSVIVLNAYPRH